MFRISRYALAHSFAQKHRFHRSRSPLRSLFNLCFWTKYCTNSYQLIFNTYLSCNLFKSLFPYPPPSLGGERVRGRGFQIAVNKILHTRLIAQKVAYLQLFKYLCEWRITSFFPTWAKDTSRNGQCSSAAKSVFTPKTCILCKIIVTYLNLS